MDLRSGDKPVVNIDHAQWSRIEQAYGSTLSQSARAGIVGATESYLFLRSFEGTPERMAKVKVILEAHDKAASRFFNELFAGPSLTSDAGSYAHYLIENNFKSDSIRGKELSLDGLLDILRAFHISCNASIKQLNDPTSSAGRKDDAWKTWIGRLAAILRNHDGARDKSGKELPFVSFAWELQACLPRECRHAAQSEAALADVITAALSIREPRSDY